MYCAFSLGIPTRIFSKATTSDKSVWEAWFLLTCRQSKSKYVSSTTCTREHEYYKKNNWRQMYLLASDMVLNTVSEHLQPLRGMAFFQTSWNTFVCISGWCGRNRQACDQRRKTKHPLYVIFVWEWYDKHSLFWNFGEFEAFKSFICRFSRTQNNSHKTFFKNS